MSEKNNAEMENKPRRKTHTSSEVKKRYNDKAYKAYTFHLRKDEDMELIEKIEAEKAKGLSTADIIRKFLSE